MPNPTPRRVRGATHAVFTLLGLALVVPSVAAQIAAPRPGGGPNFPAGGGGAIGNPPQPGAPGGNAAFGNVPQPSIPGANGVFGKVPQPGIPGGDGGFGNVPQPGMPGGNFPGAGGGATGNIPGTGNFAGQPPMSNFPKGPTFPTGPLLERVWSCEKCGKEVGRGNFPPSSCQHCGVQLINGIGRGDLPTGTGTSPNMPITAPGTGMPSGPGVIPMAPTTPYVPPSNYPPANYPSTTYTTTPAPATAPSSRPLGTVLIIIAGVVTGVVLLIVIGVIATVVIARGASKRPARRSKVAARRKRKVRDEDDDD